MPAMIYLDNSATTRVRAEAQEAMRPFLGHLGGNPSSLHRMGREAQQAVVNARQQVADLVGCTAAEIFFSPCATYSNNVAILGRARFIDSRGGGKHLITSVIEHPACLGPAKFLEANGWQVTYLPVDDQGMISVQDLERALRPDTSIISLMWANNEIGSLFPVRDLAALAKERGIFFHTDAVQVPGKLAINVGELQTDTLALSGHKFYAPKGVGVLFKRAGVELHPIFHGGGQEGGLFPGTEAVANIVGIGKAAELARMELPTIQPHLREMQAILANELLSLENVRMTGPTNLENRLPGHVSVVVSGIEGEAAVLQCDLKGLYVSSASACHKGTMEPSHVVAALGLKPEMARGSLRISAGRFNTVEECRQAVQTVTKVVSSLRKSGMAVR
jgi:cysteine desulfurase